MISDHPPVTDLSPIYDEIARFFAAGPSPQAILDYRLSESSDHLIARLLEANRTRGLSAEEQSALDDYTRIERLMQSIKVQAMENIQRIISNE